MSRSMEGIPATACSSPAAVHAGRSAAARLRAPGEMDILCGAAKHGRSAGHDGSIGGNRHGKAVSRQATDAAETQGHVSGASGDQSGTVLRTDSGRGRRKRKRKIHFGRDIWRSAAAYIGNRAIQRAGYPLTGRKGVPALSPQCAIYFPKSQRIHEPLLYCGENPCRAYEDPGGRL